MARGASADPDGSDSSECPDADGNTAGAPLTLGQGAYSVVTRGLAVPAGTPAAARDNPAIVRGRRGSGG